MKVFVAGGTGVLGRATVQALRDAGHQVRTTARGTENAQLARRLGAVPLEVDLYDAAAVRRAIAGLDAVLRLTTKIPSLLKMGSAARGSRQISCGPPAPGFSSTRPSWNGSPCT